MIVPMLDLMMNGYLMIQFYFHCNFKREVM
ncbi:hypothetical protein NVP1121O_263, partial [Vibrio phage 1.121.O._10N.286.46.C4]